MLENEAGQAAPVVADEAPKTEAEQLNAALTAEGTETHEGEEKQAPVEKTFTQKELDEHIQKRLAKSEARAERRAKEAYREALEAVTRQQQVQQRQTSNEPTREQFASDADWIDAKVEYRLQQRDSAKAQEASHRANESVKSKALDIFAKAEKLPGFDREAFEELPISQTVADAILESDVAPELMAYMSSNPDEAQRIAKLSQARQAVELGKLEVKLQQTPKAKQSNAARPLEAVKGGGVPAGMPDPANTKQYIKWANEQERARR